MSSAALFSRCLVASFITVALSGSVQPLLAQDLLKEPAASCCGPITPAARQLLQVLDGADVEHLWLAHQHVDWLSGREDSSVSPSAPGHSTHCSAFAAAIGERVGVYLLRPPEHGQVLLANAQTAWLGSEAARAQGWQGVEGPLAAQSLANQGQLVVVSFASPNPRRPGHIAIVRPSLKSTEALAADGPEITQAGASNHSDWTARRGFAHHAGAWPDGVRYFAHALP